MVMKKLEQYYQHFVQGNISSEFRLASEHGMPTPNYGNECGHLGSPFIQK